MEELGEVEEAFIGCVSSPPAPCYRSLHHYDHLEYQCACSRAELGRFEAVGSGMQMKTLERLAIRLRSLSTLNQKPPRVILSHFRRY